jgi:PAS domain S-box-containing protein
MRSVSAKLTVLNLFCAALVAAALYFLMDRQLTRIMKERFVGQGHTVAAATAKSVEPFLIDHDPTSIQSAIDQVLALPDVEWAYVSDPGGRVLAHTFIPKFPDALIKSDGSSRDVWQVKLPESGDETTVFSKPVLTGIVGAVHVGFSPRKLTESIHQLELVILASILIVMFVSTTIVAVFSARVMGPIRELTRAAALIGAEGDASYQDLPVRTNDEVGVLTAAFNRMVGDVRNHREHLEERVEERTVELSRVNDSLKSEIHERLQAERELAAETANLNALIENNPLAIAVLDHGGVLRMCNPAFERLFGWQQSEILGTEIHRITAAANADEEAGWISKEDLSECTHVNTQRSRRDGSAIDVDVYDVPLRIRDEHVGSFRVYQDITERKKLEVELRQAQKLEAVGRLASGIAHEINTPIQFVGDNLRFLQDAFGELASSIEKYEELAEAAGNGAVSPELLKNVSETAASADLEYLSGEVPRALAQTLDGVERIATIVNAMKEFAHPEQKQKVAADLNQALASTLVVAGNELKHVADVETAFGELPPLKCYPGELNQVFINLLVNAAHAIADAVKENHQRGLIRVTTQREGDWVRIAISDTGCGIPEEIRDRVFDPFFTTKDVGRGAGQGLAISRSIIVEKHRGTLTFSSHVGRGTTFHIGLPVSEPAG